MNDGFNMLMMHTVNVSLLVILNGLVDKSRYQLPLFFKGLSIYMECLYQSPHIHGIDI
jgi:hypothetical protein